MIAATVVVDLTRDTPEADRAALHAVAGPLPADARVVLDVGRRTFPTASTVDRLQQLEAKVVWLDVHGSAAAVVAWIDALRDPTFARPGRW